MIAIVDYGIGNIHSLISAFKNLGEEVMLTGDPEVIKSAEIVILPGVGAFKFAMQSLRERDLIETLEWVYASGKPLIGICLGMQLFYETSEEHGHCDGLGFLKGHVRLFESNVKIPHMGWNALSFSAASFYVNSAVDTSPYVYFVHSYYAEAIDAETLVAWADYGDLVPAIVKQNNLIGFQFHPEKSGALGQKLLLGALEALR